jgi:hypothetical protein
MPRESPHGLDLALSEWKSARAVPEGGSVLGRGPDDLQSWRSACSARKQPARRRFMMGRKADHLEDASVPLVCRERLKSRCGIWRQTARKQCGMLPLDHRGITRLG